MGLPKASALLAPPLEQRTIVAAARSTWQPNENFRSSLRKGMSGWEVWSIQVALKGSGFALVEDGVFGPATDSAVRSLQAALHVTVDGICGPQTQAAMCARECAHAEHGLTPTGLLKGICFGESGGIIPCTSTRYANGSRDYGPLQDNLLNPSDDDLALAFNPAMQALSVARARRSKHDGYLHQAGVNGSQERAWRLAVLSYNWPAAADQIAAGHEATWEYTSEGERFKLSDPAPWIEHIGVKGVSTGAQWCHFYVESKIIYVTSWTA